MSLKPTTKHKSKKPPAKGKRTPTQRQKGRGGWPDYDDRENIFFTPVTKPYAEVLTIRSPAAADASVSWMREEYNRASGKKKGFTRDPKWEEHIHKAMDNTGKRAEMSVKRPNISGKEKTEMRKVSTIYKKALASKAFGNYYGKRITKSVDLQSGQGKKGGIFPVKGKTAKTRPIKAGQEILKFRQRSVTTGGKVALVWRPFRMVYRSGSKRNVNAKVAELQKGGYPTRILRDGKMYFVYAHQEGRGKWKYQPADQWFFKAVAKKQAEQAKKRKYEKDRKAKQRADKKVKAKKEKKIREAAAKLEAKKKAEKAAARKAKRDAKKKSGTKGKK